jgi:glycosyltransferase involved in cell wall biosynthesis
MIGLEPHGIGKESNGAVRYAAGHVLIVCAAGYVSGKEIMALELGCGLRDSGRSTSFITSFWHNGDFAARLARQSISARTLPIGFISATLTGANMRMTAEQLWHWPGLLWNYHRTLALLRPFKVVHTNWHHLLLLLPFLRPERDLFWIHECMPDSPRYRRLFRRFEKRLGCFVCVSQAVASSLRGLGIPEEKLRVIHNGLADPAASTWKRPAGNGRFRLGIVGQVGPWKGHDDLLDAFAQVNRRHPLTELHIYGTGDAAYRNTLVRRSVELGVVDQIVWHGFVTDPGEIYGTLDLCMVPSRFPDPLPTSALEAGFFGIPSVVTRCGGLPEIVEQGINGLLVDAAAPADLAAAICRMIEDPQLHRAMQHNARKMAVERFGAERFLNDFTTVLALHEQVA